jgi:hypothetical protein
MDEMASRIKMDGRSQLDPTTDARQVSYFACVH